MIPRLLIWLATGPLKVDSPAYHWIIARGEKVKWRMFLAVLCLYPLVCLLSWIRLLFRKLTFRKPSVLWTPSPILTITESSALLKRMGYRSKTLVFTVYYITNKFDYNMQPVLANPAANQWFSGWLFLWSLLRFDVYHFFYDGGLWSGMKIVPWARWIEFPLLRLAGKRIVATAYGADVRTRKRNEMWRPWNICRECPDPGRYCVCDDTTGLRISRYHRDWCNEILAMGDMHDFIYSSRPDFVYWPIDVKEVAFVGTPTRLPGEPVIVAHSPNHRYFKGTRFIEASIERLRAKGHNVALDVVERVSNVEAKRRYAASDIVFAQCILGWPGYTEIEAMAAGKPVLTNVRDPELYLGHISNWPAITVAPETIDDVLERLILDPAERKRLGEAGRRHVEEHWSYEGLAPHYRSLHDRVWKRNGLRANIKAKRKELRHGDCLARPGRPSKPGSPGEFRVWTDPRVEERRIAWGLHGRSAFDGDGRLLMHGPDAALPHPATSALHAMTVFHAHLEAPDAIEHSDRFRAAARFLAACVSPNTHGRATLATTRDGYVLSLPWLPARAVAVRALALPVLIRAWKVFGLTELEPHAHDVACALGAPRSEGGAWFGEGSVRTFIDGYATRDVARLSAELQAALALVEYEALVDADWVMPLVQQAARSIDACLAGTPLEALFPIERLGTEFLMDEPYFVAAAVEALGQRTRLTSLEERGHRLRKDIRRWRWRKFREFASPL